MNEAEQKGNEAILSTLVSGVIGSLYEADPEKAVLFLTQVLNDAGRWFGFDGEKRIVH